MGVRLAAFGWDGLRLEGGGRTAPESGASKQLPHLIAISPVETDEPSDGCKRSRPNDADGKHAEKAVGAAEDEACRDKDDGCRDQRSTKASKPARSQGAVLDAVANQQYGKNSSRHDSFEHQRGERGHPHLADAYQEHHGRTEVHQTERELNERKCPWVSASDEVLGHQGGRLSEQKGEPEQHERRATRLKPSAQPAAQHPAGQHDERRDDEHHHATRSTQAGE